MSDPIQPAWNAYLRAIKRAAARLDREHKASTKRYDRDTNLARDRYMREVHRHLYPNKKKE